MSVQPLIISLIFIRTTSSNLAGTMASVDHNNRCKYGTIAMNFNKLLLVHGAPVIA